MSGWRDAARCKGRDVSLWFPGPYDELGARVAVAFCSRCAVRRECLDSALLEEAGSDYPPAGIRGAVTAAERTVMLRATRGREHLVRP